jgi:hypothetical protein
VSKVFLTKVVSRVSNSLDTPTSASLDGKVSVEQYISETIHILNGSRFWVKIQCPTHLCDCSLAQCDDLPLPDSPHNPTKIFKKMLIAKKKVLFLECLKTIS